jgi:hypothetical protein
MRLIPRRTTRRFQHKELAITVKTITDFHCKNHTKHENTLSWQNAEFPNVKVGGT